MAGLGRGVMACWGITVWTHFWMHVRSHCVQFHKHLPNLYQPHQQHALRSHIQPRIELVMMAVRVTGCQPGCITPTIAQAFTPTRPGTSPWGSGPSPHSLQHFGTPHKGWCVLDLQVSLPTLLSQPSCLPPLTHTLTHTSPQQVRDHMHSRAYIGQYSPSGDFFIAAFQVSGYHTPNTPYTTPHPTQPHTTLTRQQSTTHNEGPLAGIVVAVHVSIISCM